MARSITGAAADSVRAGRAGFQVRVGRCAGIGGAAVLLRLKFGPAKAPGMAQACIIAMKQKLDGEATVPGGVAGPMPERSNGAGPNQPGAPDWHGLADRLHPGTEERGDLVIAILDGLVKAAF